MRHLKEQAFKFSSFFFFCLLFERVACTLDWPGAYYVGEDDHEFLFHLLSSPKY